MLKRHLSYFFLLCVTVFSTPFFAGAQVVINEIAWMGTTADPNGSYCEWIELANIGHESVNLNGWTLSIGATTKIFNGESGATLSIAPDGFYLIERLTPTACPDPVPSIPADWSISFGSGISNSGTTITLADASGALIDRIDASDGWPAGDNTTKETAGRVGSAWVTNTPTPRAVNVVSSGTNNNTSQQETSATDTSNTSGSNTSSGGTTGSSSFPVEPQIYANAGPDKTVQAGADVLFEGQALGIEKKPLPNARFIWSFGDGGTKEGQNVLHHYSYPGEYIVVLDIASGKFSASDRARVRVIPASISISAVGVGTNPFIELSNTSQTELDISWWRLSAGEHYFTIPKNTFIPPESPIRFVASVTGLPSTSGSDVALLYPNGELAYRYGTEAIDASPVAKSVEERVSTQSASLPVVSASYPQATKENGSARAEQELGSYEEASDTPLALTAGALMPLEATQESSLTKWLLALFGVTFTGVAGVIFIRRKEETTEGLISANEITILD